MMYWNDHGMNGWGLGLMTFSMLLFLGLIIFGVVLLVRHLDGSPQQHPSGRPTPPPPERPAPEQLLAERLARGEIDADDYHQRLEALRTGAGRPPAGRPS
ncbi:hypothetical protein GCM10010441_06800 [Kitasatospora paracochleata]|uniref:Membrane protein n=1 Tax=Kitasatospora paracochleata TaxID=58354 RepID=A0ABT1J7K8_9ACTN|nr:SHOCT domain-containing protein [Kitasatospora paracochleata]MCP2313383.1 putative membrane protein [Kitasatospora paracochleata]